MKKVLILSVLLITLAGCTGGYNAHNPSPEAYQAIYSGYNDLNLCKTYFRKSDGVLLRDEVRHRIYKAVLSQIEERNLDCNFFPELADKESWGMEDWIKEYEESLEL